MAVNNYIKWPAERIRQDENNRLISDVQITTWNGKADADHNHDDKYIPLTGTSALTGNITPSEGINVNLGDPSHLYNMIATKSFYLGGPSPKIVMQVNEDNPIVILNGKNK